MTWTRRRVLSQSASAGALLLAGPACMSDDGFLEDEDGNPICPDPLAGADYVEDVPFANEVAFDFGTLFNQGWDGRRLYDLTQVEHANLVVPNGEFYVRTMRPDLLDTPAEDWQIRVDGLVSEPRDIHLDELLPLVRDQGRILLECSGNGIVGSFGLMSSARWAGVPFSAVLEWVDVLPEATMVLVSGFDEHSQPSQFSVPGASWVFDLDDLAAHGAFLATELNGSPLPGHNGYPIRLLVPRWYGCSCIKWVNEIRLTDASEPATAHMREYAFRTHQSAVHDEAWLYRPATMDQAAVVTRVERWDDGGRVVYRVLGIQWGGEVPNDRLSIVFTHHDSGEETVEPVDVCPVPTSNLTWTVWAHRWEPVRTGEYRVALRVDDPEIRTRRLDTGYYAREVGISEVSATT